MKPAVPSSFSRSFTYRRVLQEGCPLHNAGSCQHLRRHASRAIWLRTGPYSLAFLPCPRRKWVDIATAALAFWSCRCSSAHPQTCNRTVRSAAVAVTSSSRRRRGRDRAVSKFEWFHPKQYPPGSFKSRTSNTTPSRKT